MTGDQTDPSGPVNDGRLLAEFASSGDSVPFEQIVRRHGPLVMGVCRGVLGRGGAVQDAEDAAQATFLTLAQKAETLGGYSSVAGWLHRVAWHVARRARSARELRVRREHEAGAEQILRQGRRGRPATLRDDDASVAEALHEELAKLPEKYRLPIVLHHVEGWTEPEIAEMLGCRLGTLSGRLSRGRAMLRDRVIARQQTAESRLADPESQPNPQPKTARTSSAPMAIVGSLLGKFTGDRAISPVLTKHLAASATAKAPASAAAKALATGAIEALAKEHLWLVTTWTAAAAAAVCVAVVGGTMAVSWASRAYSDPVQSLPNGSRPAAPSSALRRSIQGTGVATVRPSYSRTGLFTGHVIDINNEPVVGARVRYYSDRESAERRDEPIIMTRTDEKGYFVLENVPADRNGFITCIAGRPVYMRADIVTAPVEYRAAADLGTIRIEPVKR